MNKKRLVVIISLVIIAVGLGILFFSKNEATEAENKEITEEDYKWNPTLILEETIVSNGKHLEVPQEWRQWYYDYWEGMWYTRGTLEFTEEGYKDVINQLDNELGIDRFEESQYKDERISWLRGHIVDGTDMSASDEIYREVAKIYADEAEAKYIMKVPDYKYQTEGNGETYVVICMIQKYSKYYMMFEYELEYKLFLPKYGE